jgi:YbbR domain-containing protein
MNLLVLIITNNFWYKVAALGLAILIWAIVQGDEILELNRTVQINIIPPENHMVRESSVPPLNATIKGPRILMGDLIYQRDLTATIRLQPHEVGELRLRVTRENFSDWDERIGLIVHEPSNVSVFVDEKQTVELPIREVLQGAPADGHIVEKVTLKPKSVSVTGLKSELKKLKEVITEPVDITGIQQSKNFDAELIAHGLTRAELSESTTTVSLQVGVSKENKKFAAVPITIVGSTNGVTVRPKYVTIELQGTPAILNFIKSTDLRAMVDISNLSAGRHDREVQVKIPTDTALIETNPDKVSVYISR